MHHGIHTENEQFYPEAQKVLQAWLGHQTRPMILLAQIELIIIEDTGVQHIEKLQLCAQQSPWDKSNRNPPVDHHPWLRKNDKCAKYVIYAHFKPMHFTFM